MGLAATTAACSLKAASDRLHKAGHCSLQPMKMCSNPCTLCRRGRGRKTALYCAGSHPRLLIRSCIQDDHKAARRRRRRRTPHATSMSRRRSQHRERLNATSYNMVRAFSAPTPGVPSPWNRTYGKKDFLSRQGNARPPGKLFPISRLFIARRGQDVNNVLETMVGRYALLFLTTPGKYSRLPHLLKRFWAEPVKLALPALFPFNKRSL